MSLVKVTLLDAPGGHTREVDRSAWLMDIAAHPEKLAPHQRPLYHLHRRWVHLTRPNQFDWSVAPELLTTHSHSRSDAMGQLMAFLTPHHWAASPWVSNHCPQPVHRLRDAPTQSFLLSHDRVPSSDAVPVHRITVHYRGHRPEDGQPWVFHRAWVYAPGAGWFEPPGWPRHWTWSTWVPRWWTGTSDRVDDYDHDDEGAPTPAGRCRLYATVWDVLIQLVRDKQIDPRAWIVERVHEWAQPLYTESFEDLTVWSVEPPAPSWASRVASPSE